MRIVTGRGCAAIERAAPILIGAYVSLGTSTLLPRKRDLVQLQRECQREWHCHAGRLREPLQQPWILEQLASQGSHELLFFRIRFEKLAHGISGKWLFRFRPLL